MTHLLILLLVFGSLSGCALLGMYASTRLPSHHLVEESASSIKLATGLIATITALVLGLLISTAKASFDAANGDLARNAINVLRLDRTLAQYGPEAQPLRALLKRSYGQWVDIVASGDSSKLAARDNTQILGHVINEFRQRFAQLTPIDAEHRQLRDRALDIADEAFAAHWLALMQEQGTIPKPLLIVLVAWLCVIFCAFGLFAPHNGTVVLFFLLCALSAAGAVFVILELDTPLSGIARVSVAPMREALSQLNR